MEAEDKTISWVDGNGNVIASGGQVNYVVTASSQAYARAIDDAESKGNALNGVSGYIIELGEKLYNGDLKLNTTPPTPSAAPPATGSLTARRSAPMPRRRCSRRSTPLRSPARPSTT